MESKRSRYLPGIDALQHRPILLLYVDAVLHAHHLCVGELERAGAREGDALALDLRGVDNAHAKAAPASDCLDVVDKGDIAEALEGEEAGDALETFVNHTTAKVTKFRKGEN